MKFILRAVINIVIPCPLILLGWYIIRSTLSIIGMLGIALQCVFALILVYLINRLLNKIIFLKLSNKENLWNIKLGIIILGLCLIGKALFIDHEVSFSIFGKIEPFLAVNCLIILVLSIPLDIILKRLKVEF